MQTNQQKNVHVDRDKLQWEILELEFLIVSCFFFHWNIYLILLFSGIDVNAEFNFPWEAGGNIWR